MKKPKAPPVAASSLTLIGWREWVALPGLAPVSIKAKIDTGAKTSALHAFFIEPYAADGRTMVKFLLHPYKKDSETVVECHAPVVDQRLVRDSGGHEEMRYVIESELQVGTLRFVAEVTLTDRDSMAFRMLLGRNALANRFLVHSKASFLLGGNRKGPAQAIG